MKYAILLVLSTAFGICRAQVPLNDSLTKRPIQITFIHPIGSNGIESTEIVNNFSINILAGYQGGLEGLELGCFVNMLKKDMVGVQMAGFGNSVMRQAHGVQMAGFYNVNGGYTKGFQAAGFANVVADSCDAFQGAGFVNFVNGNYNGGQFAGFCNLVNGNISGLQLSGFANINQGKSSAVSITGFANISSKNIIGTQISGFVNLSGDSMRGAQIAGFANIANGNIKGTQVSGFVNAAKKVDGYQIGFINISDTIENGFAFGFLNLSKSGYRTFELKSSATLYGNISFKTGTEKLYNIFTFGLKPIGGSMVWAYGYGLGTKRNISKKLSMNFDLTCHQVLENSWRHDAFHILNTIELDFASKAFSNLEIFAGPSMNVVLSSRRDVNGNLTAGKIAPWTMTDEIIDRKAVQSFVGFQAGIRF